MGAHDRFGDANKAQPRIKTVKEFVLPVVSLVVTVVTQVTAHPLLKWLSLAAFFVSLEIILYPAIASKIRSAWNRRRDDGLAQKATPGFKKLLSEFVSFVGRPTQDCETVYTILEVNFRSPDRRPLEGLNLLPIHIFRELSIHIELRMLRKGTTLDNLADVIGELNLLVMWFCSNCVKQVFCASVPEFRSALTDTARSSLEDIRQQFVKFIEDYSEFQKNLNKSLSKPASLCPDFYRPKPI